MRAKLPNMAICLCLAAAVAGGGGISPRAQASSAFVINSALDESDATPGDGLCVSTPSGQCTLRAAVEEANALAGADSITFAITGSIGLNSSLIIVDSLAVTGPGANLLMLSSAQYPPTYVEFAGGNSSLSGVALNATGILLVGLASLNLMSASVTNNAYASGLELRVAPASATVVDSTFSGNNNNGPGAIYNIEGTLVVINSTISNNSSQFVGGGIFNVGTATIMNSTIISNSTGGGFGAGIGGGIDNWGKMSLVNSTVSGNSALFNVNSDGGGIANGGVLTITSSTIAGNTSSLGTGGGLRVITGTVTLLNTIIANSPAGGDCSQAGGAIVDAGHNLVRDNSCGFSGGADPLLGPIQDNGGPTFTQALLAGSPAIDAGNPAGCADGFASLLAFDQRGRFRTFDGDGNGSAICDIGAYEYNSTLPIAWLNLPLVLR